MNLLELQRRMSAAVMRPLTPSGDIDAQPEGASFIKPNDRLSSLERLEIYNRQYWYRVIDSFYEDFPGLCAVLGQRAFDRLAEAYIADSPSQSFTLRDLGGRLEEWLRTNPGYAGRKLELALEMVRLEWAHIVAFDGGPEQVLGPEDLLELGPEFRAGVQPYVSLLSFRYPVDELRIRVNATLEEHGATSNAVGEPKKRSVLAGLGRMKAKVIYCAVHRWDFSVYYRRLVPEEFRLLTALRGGCTFGEAIDTAFADSTMTVEETQRQIETSFRSWAELGWLCRPLQDHRD
jgi:hypothetical protein